MAAGKTVAPCLRSVYKDRTGRYARQPLGTDPEPKRCRGCGRNALVRRAAVHATQAAESFVAPAARGVTSIGRGPISTQHTLELDASPERVNDFAPPFVMNLLRKAVMISG